MLLTWQEDIRPGKDMITARAICFDGQGVGRSIIMWNCHGQHGNQLWKYYVRVTINLLITLVSHN